MAPTGKLGERIDRLVIVGSAVFSALVIGGLLPFAIQRYGSNPDNARYFMGAFLIVSWVVVGWRLMKRYQAPILAFVRRWEHKPKTAFVLSSLR